MVLLYCRGKNWSDKLNDKNYLLEVLFIDNITISDCYIILSMVDLCVNIFINDNSKNVKQIKTSSLFVSCETFSAY